eukprot:CAMPEP_0179872732 /NCGR_PEP_ID=MMETSP0982-20121206/21696_1 /TAXON_ID=483367 /ORGANISM="non described non described, Strain CCMP 2436" /LENGTH=68 /DNA_ID=CAMNT_0021763849 /DNA_START=18 /DNA_END=220 /DNA_ORIENTATION=-
MSGSTTPAHLHSSLPAILSQPGGGLRSLVSREGAASQQHVFMNPLAPSPVLGSSAVLSGDTSFSLKPS